MWRKRFEETDMVTSHTKFYVCKKCGYTYGFHDIIRDESGKKDKDAINAITKRSPYIIVKCKHKNAHDHYCNNTLVDVESLLNYVNND